MVLQVSIVMVWDFFYPIRYDKNKGKKNQLKDGKEQSEIQINVNRLKIAFACQQQAKQLTGKYIYSGLNVWKETQKSNTIGYGEILEWESRERKWLFLQINSIQI